MRTISLSHPAQSKLLSNWLSMWVTLPCTTPVTAQVAFFRMRMCNTITYFCGEDMYLSVATIVDKQDTDTAVGFLSNVVDVVYSKIAFKLTFQVNKLKITQVVPALLCFPFMLS